MKTDEKPEPGPGPQVDPELVTALAEAIGRLADSALSKPWADLLGAYGMLIRAEMGGAYGMPPADFTHAIEIYSRAVYAAESAQAGRLMSAGGAFEDYFRSAGPQSDDDPPTDDDKEE